MADVLKTKIPVGILGATGMVGQRFITLLADHPWFETACLAASPRSAGKPYADAVAGRWAHAVPIPETAGRLTVGDAESDLPAIVERTAVVFSAVDMEKEKTRRLEEAYAARGVAVVSCNAAHRWTGDVPMLIPEINPHHLACIDVQRKRRGWTRGLIAVKPNCSIQSYVPVLEPLRVFGPKRVIVTTCQAISGAGKTFDTWPEMADNVIPYIPGEEKKSEEEPLKVWGTVRNGILEPAQEPVISATCIRVPVTDGHLASVSVAFARKPSREEIIGAIRNWKNPIRPLNLPSSPEQFLEYFEQEDRPQTRLDRDAANGMAVAFGRLREDTVMDWKFVALSHNTLRGAAGGAVLIAELLVKKGYVDTVR
jgi:aspartate-semialdehyde dehydrogenase